VVGEAGVSPSFYHVMFQVSANGTTCDFSAFAPYLQLGYAILYSGWRVSVFR
jgi:hypothetical protein